MGKSLSAFAVSMRGRAERFKTLGSELNVAGSGAMLRELVEVTPVDTSEAISNWRVGLGTRPSAQLPPHFHGRRGSTRGASSERSISEGLEELKMKRPGQVVFVSNTAKHIVDLDSGTSAQFAGGFISRGLIIFRLAVRAAAKRLIK